MNAVRTERVGIVLAGHGVPATDCPPQLVGELMGLEWSGSHHGGDAAGGVGARIAELDARIRSWPRTGQNDPYKAGLERLAEVLRPLLSDKIFAIGYNEFCSPSVPEAIHQVIREGASRVLVIPTMLTPGGVHSEQDIPRSLEKVRADHPGVSIDYVWPFDLQEVARLLAHHIEKVIGS